MSLLLLFGVKNSSRFNLAITILNVAIILFVIMYVSLRASNRSPIIKIIGASPLRSLGATEVDTNNWDPFFPYGFEGSFQGAGTVFFSFIGTPHSPHARAHVHTAHARATALIAGANCDDLKSKGFDSVTTLAGEVANPGRDLPLGIGGTLGIATALYVGVSLIITGAALFLPPQLHSPPPLTMRLVSCVVCRASQEWCRTRM